MQRAFYCPSDAADGRANGSPGARADTSPDDLSRNCTDPGHGGRTKTAQSAAGETSEETADNAPIVAPASAPPTTPAIETP